MEKPHFHILKTVIIDHDPVPYHPPLLGWHSMNCPLCGTQWSADFRDYAWMQKTDLIICSCGEHLCRVRDLSKEISNWENGKLVQRLPVVVPMNPRRRRIGATRIKTDQTVNGDYEGME